MLVQIDSLDHWETVLQNIDKDCIPLDCVKKVMFKLEGGKQRTINLKKLRDNGLEIEEIEIIVTRKMINLGDQIENMDFVIDVQSVAAHIQPITDKVLEKL